MLWNALTILLEVIAGLLFLKVGSLCAKKEKNYAKVFVRNWK